MRMMSPRSGDLLKSKKVVYYYNPKNKKIISPLKNSFAIFIKKELNTYYFFMNGDIISIYYPGKHFIGFVFDKINL